jgi:hypothetical protein
MSGSGVAAAKANRPICKDRGGIQMIVSYRSSQPRVAAPHFVFRRACYLANMSSKMVP